MTYKSVEYTEDCNKKYFTIAFDNNLKYCEFTIKLFGSDNKVTWISKKIKLDTSEKSVFLCKLRGVDIFKTSSILRKQIDFINEKLSGLLPDPDIFLVLEPFSKKDSTNPNNIQSGVVVVLSSHIRDHFKNYNIGIEIPVDNTNIQHEGQIYNNYTKRWSWL